MPLPPEIIVFADVNSGLSDFVSSSLTYSDTAGMLSGLIFSTSQASDFISAALKAVGLTVKTFFASDD